MTDLVELVSESLTIEKHCECAYARPFSSFPKYFVHLSLRASLPNFELFRHLLEQNHRIEPSFLTYIMPVPAGNSLPQNEHFLGLGKNHPQDSVLVFIF